MNPAKSGIVVDLGSRVQNGRMMNQRSNEDLHILENDIMDNNKAKKV